MKRKLKALLALMLSLLMLSVSASFAEEEEYPDFDLDTLSEEEFNALIEAESMDDGGFEAFALEQIGEDETIDAELLADNDFAQTVDPDAEGTDGEEDIFEEVELSEEDQAFIAAIEEADAQAEIEADAEQDGIGVLGIILIVLGGLGVVFVILYIRYKRRQARRRRRRAQMRRKRP